MIATAQDIGTVPGDRGLDRILKLAIFAVGGQGGGVLSGWIVSLAERNGYCVQATSVAGVAQRTGSTIYYVEMLPESDAAPVFALAPVEGDVDIVVAAELMEAGRALARGYVIPGSTRIILSTHRQLAAVEKMVPGDGRADSKAVLDAIRDQAGTTVAFDMARIAEAEGTVISAALFGAIAGSGALPFDPECFRETIRASGHGVEESLAAFERARAIAAGDAKDPEAETAPARHAGRPRGPERDLEAFAVLEDRVAALPAPAQIFASAGLRKLVEFQDVGYGSEYLEQLESVAGADRAAGGTDRNFQFTATAAKYLANAMAYDDIIRVADAKTRPGRGDRIAGETGAAAGDLVHVTEYTRPGAAEIVSLLPVRIGRFVSGRRQAMATIDRIVNRGRTIRSDRIGGFLALYLFAGLRRWRRSLLRHAREIEHRGAWLSLALARLPQDYDFAVETLRCRRLIKGYSHTHSRGLSRFDRVIAGTLVVTERKDAADWTRRLVDAALADHTGAQLDGALATIRSFAEPGNGKANSSV